MIQFVSVKVHHAKKIISTFTDTKPIGIFRLDVATVFNEKEHAFERKWAQLINPESIESTCGHLLVSIGVTERGVPSRVIIFLFDNVNLFLYLFSRMSSLRQDQKMMNLNHRKKSKFFFCLIYFFV